MPKTKKPSRIPTFKTEDEEREFWATHDATEYFDETEEVTEPLVYTGSPRKSVRQTVEVPLEPACVRRLNHIAKARGLRVEDLLSLWVAERLAHER